MQRILFVCSLAFLFPSFAIGANTLSLEATLILLHRISGYGIVDLEKSVRLVQGYQAAIAGIDAGNEVFAKSLVGPRARFVFEIDDAIAQASDDASELVDSLGVLPIIDADIIEMEEGRGKKQSFFFRLGFLQKWQARRLEGKKKRIKKLGTVINQRLREMGIPRGHTDSVAFELMGRRVYSEPTTRSRREGAFSSTLESNEFIRDPDDFLTQVAKARKAFSAISDQLKASEQIRPRKGTLTAEKVFELLASAYASLQEATSERDQQVLRDFIRLAEEELNHLARQQSRLGSLQERARILHIRPIK